MIFSYFKHFCIYFNVNEHLAVSFVEFERGGSLVGNFCFFCLHRITCLSIPRVFSSSLLRPIIAWKYLPNFKIFFKFCTFLPKFSNILLFLSFFNIFSPFLDLFLKKRKHALSRIVPDSYSHKSLILFFAFCLFAWWIKLKCTPHPSHH